MKPSLRFLYVCVPCRPIRSSLPIQRLFTWHLVHPRYLSSHPSQQPVNSSSYHAQLNKLLSNIGYYLSNAPTSKQVDHYVHHKLDEFLPSTSEPYVAYNKVISSLLQHGYSQEAVGVYQRMQKSGFLALPQIHAEMLAAMLAQGDTNSSVIEALNNVLKDPLFTEGQFVKLLQTMQNLGVSNELLSLVGENFVKARGEGYSPGGSLITKLVDIQTRAGRLDDALGSILRFEDRRALPFATVIKGLTETRPHDTDLVNKTLSTMQDIQVLPDIAVFNALLSRELRRRSLRGTFSIYHIVIKFSLATSLSPNASTFGVLFSALAKLFKPDIHSSRIPFRRSNAVPPRQLYRDLLFFRERSSFAITSDLLNRALRAFLKTHDYAGAYVVLGSFRIFRLTVTAKTYHLVTEHLTRRVRWDIKTEREREETRWGDRFMGIQSKRNFKEVWKSNIDKHYAIKILTSASRTEFSLTDYLFGHKFGGEPKYESPTIFMMNGHEPVPESLVLSIVPLQRLLRRAIAAAAETKNDEEVSLSSRTYDAIFRAKQDMFPTKEHPYDAKSDTES